MGENTNIAWCDSTWNPWIGCTKVSPGCDHCYASVSTPARSMRIKWGAGNPRHRTSHANWLKPLAWNDRPFYECRACGWRGDRPGKMSGMVVCPQPHCAGIDLPRARRRVFCASLADVFDSEVPDAWRDDLFELICGTPFLTWMLLTKRIGLVDRYVSDLPGWPWPNVSIGATIVNQEESDRDVCKLLGTPAAVRFLSIEPMLGPIDLRDPPNDMGEPRFSYLERVDDTGPRIDWVIVGGESDQASMRARPVDVRWVRDIVRQCRAAGTAAFVKQLGAFVVDRNDAGFEGDGDDLWPNGTADKLVWDPLGYVDRAQGAPIRIKLRDRAGADPAEWPEDLRVREFPR